MRTAIVAWSLRDPVLRRPPRQPAAAAIAQVAEILRADGLIAYPTDSGFALGCLIGRAGGSSGSARSAGLDDRHHFTLVCHDVARPASSRLDNAVFRAVKATTPGPYTFILPATKEVPDGCCTRRSYRGGAHPGRRRRAGALARWASRWCRARCCCRATTSR